MKGLPIVGNSLAMLFRPWDFLQEAYRTFGPAYRVNVMFRNATVLAGPEVKDLYSEAGENILDRTFFYKTLQEELAANELIFCTKGKRHKEIRRCSSLGFSRHVAAEHLPETAAEILRSFQDLERGKNYDVTRLTGDALIIAAGPMLGGCDLRGIVDDLRKYSSDMMEVTVGTRSQLALWRPSYRRAKRTAFAFSEDLLKKWRGEEIKNKAGSYVVGCFAETRDQDGNCPADRDLIPLILLTFVGMGVYTNRVVSFMLYELFRNDDLRRRVVEEVDRCFAEGITYDGLRDLTLLHAVYCETLRRYPIWFLIPFRAEEDFDFSGYRIRSGDFLLISSVQEHFLPENYPDPERFDPERCLPPRNEHLRRGAFSPFGSGSRRCVATGQVEIMALLFAALILHRGNFVADPQYELKVRLRPLPAPYLFSLQFNGMREPLASNDSDPAKQLSRAEKLGLSGDRLLWDETEMLRTAVDKEMEIQVFPAGSEVFRQGDKPDAFYVVESGEVVVLQTKAGVEEKLAVLGQGDVFGELGLLRRQPRLATIKVAPGVERLVVLKCSANAFERLLGNLNIVGEELIALIQNRKIATSLARLLPNLSRDETLALVPGASFRRGRSGEVFFREGDPADALYIIERGSFEVVAELGRGLQRVLARLEKGDVFGEMGLLRKAPRAATVRVTADCETAETLVISKEPFLRLIERDSPFREKVFSDLARREEMNRGL